MPSKKEALKLRGEFALLLVILINSFGVVLMLYSGSGISAISSVPYAFSEVLPFLSLGTWTYIFQGLLIAILMIMRRRFVFQYLFSFIVGFFFGIMIDIHEMWIHILPTTMPFRILYFLASYCIISFGISLSNRCKMPIIPTDLFPREFAAITGKEYSKIKIPFDVLCLSVTAIMTFFFLGQVKGLGLGTVLAAFTMGKFISIIGRQIDKKVFFTSVMAALS